MDAISAPITGAMPTAQILALLSSRGCKDVSSQLDLSKTSTLPTLSGGNGRIYHGRLYNGTRVAVKTLLITAAQGTEDRRKLMLAAHELYIWTKCKHPNFLELIGVAMFHDSIAMVSPWMENSTLSWFIDQNPQIDRYAMCAQVADGIAYMHLSNIVHGDIKGANILVTRDQTVKIMDFGSSTLRHEYSLKFEVSKDEPAFSVRWAAPELLAIEEGAEAKVTIESDVYALGMTILEIISGKVPYHEFTKDFNVMIRITQRICPTRPEQNLPINNMQADSLWSLMKDTWVYEPRYRPSANVVRDRVNMINTYGKYQPCTAPANWETLSRINGFETAMSILPEVACLAKLTKQSELTAMLMELPSKPVAMAISHGKHLKALEWMEQSRSTVWNQTFRPPISAWRIQSIDSLLSYKLQQTRDALYYAGVKSLCPKASETHSQGLESVAQRHRQLAGECSQLIDEILSRPDFINFIPCKQSTEALCAAPNGTTVMINLTDLHCDALILIPHCHKVRHIPLLGISKEKVTAACDAMHRALRHDGIMISRVDVDEIKRTNSGGVFKEILEFLWDTIAHPVLKFLGYLNVPPTGELPRLTWCVTGRMAFLPLHAAGYYDRPKCGVCDFVVSSYTPSLSVLLSASPAPSIPHSRLLVVGQPHTPGFSPLLGTRSELNAIGRHAEGRITISWKDGFDARLLPVLQDMESCDWIHFACHSIGRPADPTESCFYLQNRSLTLNEILQKSFRGKGLAFLSGCNMVAEDDLANEAVPLASGMLMGGYQSVIASMWAVFDSDAPIVADKLYETLLKDGRMDYRDSARALHAAVNHLRDTVGYENFIRWVPYIHVGS